MPSSRQFVCMIASEGSAQASYVKDIPQLIISRNHVLQYAAARLGDKQATLVLPKGAGKDFLDSWLQLVQKPAGDVHGKRNTNERISTDTYVKGLQLAFPVLLSPIMKNWSA